VRFVRDHLGLSNTQFAELMGVTPTQSSRWTNSEAIGLPAERFLRVLATLGPDLLNLARQQPPSSAADDVTAARAGRAEEALEDLARPSSIAAAVRRSKAAPDRPAAQRVQLDARSHPGELADRPRREKSAGARADLTSATS